MKLTDWQGKWIWCEGEPSPRNFHWCSRDRFEVPAEFSNVKLNITADSRYSLWINGRCVGRGPVRAFTHKWRYDTYDITSYVAAGQNVVAVLVEHFGHSTFQYCEERAGLLVQVECDCEIVAASDESWLGKAHPSYSTRTSRISCQQAWVEEFDARKDPLGWTDVDFDDSDWAPAVVVGEAGCEPWLELIPRDIPFLTQEAVHPVRILRTQAVNPPSQVWTMDLKPNLLPGDLSANKRELPGLIATSLRCSKLMRVSINTFYNDFARMRIDGVEVSQQTAAEGIELDKGEHLVIIDLMRAYHEWFMTLIFQCDRGAIELSSPLDSGSAYPFVTIGPVSSSEDPAYCQAWNATCPQQIAQHPLALPICFEHTVDDNISALTSLARITDAAVRINDESAMLVESEDYTTIFPSKCGDTEVRLDFGREIVGFVELDLSAPEGVEIDFNGFENIQDERIQWTSSGWCGLNNVFRYVTREEWQGWRSIVRRGFRYATLTFRFPEGCTEPVKMRGIRCHLNTYPFVERGQFSCSDPLLNRIWEMSSRTVRLCSEDTFVDCPSYEQVLWVGDARNESLYSYLAFGDGRLARRSLLLAGESLHRSPLVESQVPSGWVNIIPAWSLFWTIACEEYFQYTGDRAFLEDIYPYIKQQGLNISERFTNALGLLEIEAWSFLDAAPMDVPDTGIIAHQNMLCVEAFRRSARIAEIVGRPDDAELYESWAQAMRDAINKHLWDKQNQAYVDSIHADGKPSEVFSRQTQTIAYLYDIAHSDKRPALERYLTELPEGWVAEGSAFALQLTIETLAKAGNRNEITRLIRKWWGLMLDHDATACWESFPADVGLDWHSRSYCHGCSAAPVFALPSYILGVQPVEPGFRRFEINPWLGDLDWARGSVPTPYGEIRAEARKEGDGINLCFSVPDGTVGLVNGKEYGKGTHKLSL